MAKTRWDQRFLASTRGQVAALLRRGHSTVDELAVSLGLTDNAVRAHLAALERDGLVRQEGLRRGPGKPAFAYDLTPDAERLFPKAYGPVLRQLLDVLATRLPAEEIEEALREVGRRLAAVNPAPAGDQPSRIRHAQALLDDLGGLVELEEQNGAVVLQGYDCPLATAVPGHPEVCCLAAALVTEIIGSPVVEQCNREGTPRCRFVISTPAPS